MLDCLAIILPTQSLSIQWDLSVLLGTPDADVGRMLEVMRTLTCPPPQQILTDRETLLGELPTLPSDVLRSVGSSAES